MSYHCALTGICFHENFHPPMSCAVLGKNVLRAKPIMIVEHRKLIAMLIVLVDSLTLSVHPVVIVDIVKVLVICESQSVKATFVSSSLLWLDFASYYHYYYCNTAGGELKFHMYILTSPSRQLYYSRLWNFSSSKRSRSGQITLRFAFGSLCVCRRSGDPTTSIIERPRASKDIHL
jgi:hypothetical protein